MATFLDISLIGHIRVIFVAILVFAIIYAVLLKTKVLGDNKTIVVMVAISAALMFSLVSSANKMLDIVIPAFVILLIFGFVLSTAFIFLGGDAKNVAGIFGENPKTMGYWVLILTILIFMGGFGKVFFDPTSSSAVVNANNSNEIGNTGVAIPDGSAVGEVGEDAFWNVIFHPKVLGFIVIMMVATFSIMYMIKSD